MTLVLVTGPEVEPLTPAEVRARLGLPASVADGLLAPLIKAARQELDGKDGWLGRALITQIWDLVLDRFPCGPIHIPLSPLISVNSIAYDDTAANEQVLASSSYRVLSGEPTRVRALVRWPAVHSRGDSIRIRFTAGYGSEGSDVPEPIRQALVEKVSLARMTGRANPALRSESVDGVSSQSWSTGMDAADALRRSIDDRLSAFRVFQ